MPVYMQTEAAECGLACLAMIACHFGFRTDLAALRRRFGMSLNGANFAQLIDYADRIRLSGRPLRLDALDELRSLTVPCILHWELNHFVVLVRADAKGIVIHDPAVGVRRLTYTEASKRFTGYALELGPGANFKPAEEQRRVALRALVGKVHGLWRAFGTVFMMAIALEALGLAVPRLTQWVVDDALVGQDRSLLNMVALGSFLLLVTQTALTQARSWTLLYWSTHLNLQWVSNVFNHLLHLPVAWFEKRHMGDVISRFGSIGAIQRIVTTSALAALLDGLMAVATLVMMLLYSPRLSMVVLATVLSYGLLRALAYGPLREASQESLILAAKEHSCFLETIRAVQAIKLFGRELDRVCRWRNLKVDSANRDIRTQHLGCLSVRPIRLSPAYHRC